MLTYILKEKGNLKKAYKMYKASKKIKQLDLFNDEFYLKKYPSVKNSKLSPLNHYLYHGYKEHKQPGPLFDNNYYLKNNPDVKQSGENPLVHYVLNGKKEGRAIVKKSNKLSKELEKANIRIDKSNKTIRRLERHINRQDDKIERLKRKAKNQTEILDSYQRLFNDLYIDHEITSKGTLKDMQDLCLELLVFFDKICEKYNLTYWLDYGTLLGPVRHGGYLPWDDDIDIGMMKKDFDKLVEVIKKELKEKDLEEFMFIREKKKYDNTITGFIQLIYKGSLAEKTMLACIDILPYDYLKNEDNLKKEELKNSISDIIEVTKEEFLEKEYFKTSPNEAYEKLNEIVGIVNHEDEYIIPSSMNLRPNRIRIYKSEEMFPLQKIKFENYEFLAAKDEKAYLTMTYGENYMKMPKKIKFHSRIPGLLNKNIDDLHGLYVREIERLKQLNNEFD